MVETRCCNNTAESINISYVQLHFGKQKSFYPSIGIIFPHQIPYSSAFCYYKPATVNKISRPESAILHAIQFSQCNAITSTVMIRRSRDRSPTDVRLTGSNNLVCLTYAAESKGINNRYDTPQPPLIDKSLSPAASAWS